VLEALVLDGDGDSRSALVALVGLARFETVAAGSLDEARRRLGERLIDVALVDLTLAGRDSTSSERRLSRSIPMTTAGPANGIARSLTKAVGEYASSARIASRTESARATFSPACAKRAPIASRLSGSSSTTRTHGDGESSEARSPVLLPVSLWLEIACIASLAEAPHPWFNAAGPCLPGSRRRSAQSPESAPSPSRRATRDQTLGSLS
jgi:hypothetical protein